MSDNIFCVVGELRHVHNKKVVTLIERTWLLVVADNEEEARILGEREFRSMETSYQNIYGDTVDIVFYRIEDVQWKDSGADIKLPYEAYTDHLDPGPEDLEL